MEFIHIEELPGVVGNLGVLTLTRCKALNALTVEMIDVLYQQLKIWQDRSDIFAVVIQSDCERAFCAGGDIRVLYDTRAHFDQQRDFFRSEYCLNYLIGSYPKPIVALSQGIVMGGGAGLSIHASHRVASETFSFAMPETAIGLFPDIGSSYFLNKMPGFLGYYLALSGTRINMADGVYAGIVDYPISSNHYPDVLQALTSTPLGNVSAHEWVSSVLANFSITTDSSMYQEKQDMIDSIFCANQVPVILDYLQHDDGEWSQAVFVHLGQKSPMSLTVTLEALQRAKDKNLAFALQQDFTLAQSFLKSHDLYEGIRAVVIDKDMNPQWQPDSLALINDSEVSDYFDTQGKESLILGDK